MAADGRVSVFSVGDVFPDLPDGQRVVRAADAALRHRRHRLRQLRGRLLGPARAARRATSTSAARRARAASFLGEVGFDVMTLANNHMIDGGYDALADTIELLRGQGIATTGAGENIVEATRPAILERDGIRVAFLGFCTRLPGRLRGARVAARPRAAARAHLLRRPRPQLLGAGHRPGDRDGAVRGRPRALPRRRSPPRASRPTSSIVAPHWGYSSWMEVLQDYELELARDAVDHGADAVMCCHHHACAASRSTTASRSSTASGTLIHHFTTIKVSAADRAARAGALRRALVVRRGRRLPAVPVPRRRAQERHRRARPRRRRHDRDRLHPGAHAARRQRPSRCAPTTRAPTRSPTTSSG